MKNMTLPNITDACKGKLFLGRNNAIGKETLEVTGVVIDSRKVEEGYLFIATRGERVDGHSFIKQVADKGAVCVICEEPPSIDTIPYILVENSFIALKQIATFYRDQLAIPVVGITGSVGKTTTKEFIAKVLEQRYCILKTQGNYNNEVGLPLTILQIRKEHEIAILEMGINQFGEMDRLGEIAKPDICVITNIGQCHLEFLGTRKGILKAKTEVLPHIKEGGYICINSDDDMLDTIESDKKIITFGLQNKGQIYAENIENQGLLGTKCNIHTQTKDFIVTIPLAGQHMIYNGLAATAVGEILGLNQEEIARGIGEVKALGGRSNIYQVGNKTIIDDCYNANPVSMKAALDLLALANTRKVAILGGMGELGEDSNKLHGEVGAYAIDTIVDVLVCIGENAKSMEKEAILQAKKSNAHTTILYYQTKEEAMNQLEQIILDTDTILIKGSRFMELEEMVGFCSKEKVGDLNVILH